MVITHTAIKYMAMSIPVWPLFTKVSLKDLKVVRTLVWRFILDLFY